MTFAQWLIYIQDNIETHQKTPQPPVSSPTVSHSQAERLPARPSQAQPSRFSPHKSPQTGQEVIVLLGKGSFHPTLWY